MLETVRKEVDDQGRIIIPKEWREELKIKEHSTVEMTKKDGEISLVPIKKKSPMDFKGIFKDVKITMEEIESAEADAAVKDFEDSRKRSIENMKKRHKNESR